MSRTQPELAAFGHYLRHLRAAADLTQETLAERSGLSTRIISNIERGAPNRPRRSTIDALADALELQNADRVAFIEAGRGTGPLSQPVRSTFPRATDVFVGNRETIQDVARILGDTGTRLLTLTGPGGVGKTRLAREVVGQIDASRFSDVVMIELEAIRDPARVLPTIARALGLVPLRSGSFVDLLVTMIGDRSLLLILDNMEQVVPAGKDLVEILERCPNVTAMITSRVTLNVRGEQIYPIAPLPVPTEHDRQQTLPYLSRHPAVELFVVRARRGSQTFELTDQNAEAVVSLVQRLDGLPLGIELAASRMNVLTPEGLLGRMASTSVLLADGPHDLPRRLRSLDSAIGWSYNLLNPSEQALFRRTSVFSGGFTLERVETLCTHVDRKLASSRNGRSDESEIVRDLSALVNSSLVQVTGRDERAKRFRLLEPIREFALAQLASSGEEMATCCAHVATFVAFTQMAERELTGGEQLLWFRRMEIEHSNIRTALAMSISQGDMESAARITGACAYFWQLHGDLLEAKRNFDSVLEVGDRLSPSVHARALLGSGLISLHLGDEKAGQAIEAALEIYEAEHDPGGIALALRQLGNVRRSHGAFEEADALQEDALGIFRKIDDGVGVATTLRNLGLGASDRGDLDRAEMLLEEARELGSSLGEWVNFAAIHNNLALVVLLKGDLPRATALQLTALKLWSEFPYEDGIANGLENLALISTTAGEGLLAAKLFGGSEAMRQRNGSSARAVEAPLVASQISQARSAVGATEFDLARARGRSMTRIQLLDLAWRVPKALHH